tara:strand:- start:16666 stop:18828 length:2163 start_codon:yes stop_codon:yes gene_type:complete
MLVKNFYKITLIFLTTFFSGCSNSSNISEDISQEKEIEVNITNPFFNKSTLVYGYPHFDKIKNSHYLPAFEKGMKEHINQINEIIKQQEKPNFENTIIKLEKSGELLNRVSYVFYSMSWANTNDSLESIRTAIAPQLSAHNDEILLNEKLFNRVENIFKNKENLTLDSESLRLLEETYKSFIRSGAKLSVDDKEKLKQINESIAQNTTTLTQNVLKEVNELAIVVDNRNELDGLSESMIEVLSQEAIKRGLDDKFVITLQNTSGQPILANLKNRKLREKIHKTSLSRGSSGGEFDNKESFLNLIKLRTQKANLLGFNNYAEYSLDEQTAKTVEAVNERLASLTPPSVRNANKEAIELQKIINSEDNNFKLESWDWDFYSEKLMQQQYQFDESEMKPFFELNNVFFKGVFFSAEKLFGLKFKEITTLPIYHPEVRTFEVFDKDESLISIFILDPYSRSSKRGGAWMNAYVPQSKLLNQKPIIANHLNINKPADKNDPTLMTFDEVITAFHEFGHAIHGILSDVNYPSFSGTSVPRDFVEFPSQVYEMWATWPEVLENYAIHFKTNEPMPNDLLQKVLDARKFNQGFKTVEYLAASLLDQAWHQISIDETPNLNDFLTFESNALMSAGIKLNTIPPRYRTTYFSHIMGGYSAGYYSYIWSEVLDADTVEWFKENGGLKMENGDHFRETLLSKGGSKDAMNLFMDFRGQKPDIKHLLNRRGLN